MEVGGDFETAGRFEGHNSRRWGFFRETRAFGMIPVPCVLADPPRNFAHWCERFPCRCCFNLGRFNPRPHPDRSNASLSRVVAPQRDCSVSSQNSGELIMLLRINKRRFGIIEGL